MHIIHPFRILTLCLSLLLAVAGSISAQVRYAGKLETSVLQFRHHTVDIDPGPNWRGYYLAEGQNGVSYETSHGVMMQEKIFLGLGGAYFNFEGMHGMGFFTDLSYRPINRSFSPVLQAKLGHSHLWNQYEGGRGTAYAVAGLGLSYKTDSKIGYLLGFNLIAMQQSSLLGLNAGIQW